MIIFHYELLQEFLAALPRNITKDIFIQYLEADDSPDRSDLTYHKIILQFLGKPTEENPYLNILHECIIPIKTKEERKKIIQEIEIAFGQKSEYKVVRGKISEIIHSY